jgi:hypothetical protein
LAEADTSEMEPAAVEEPAPEPEPAPVQQRLDGVTESADWGWGEPDEYSAPV